MSDIRDVISRIGEGSIASHLFYLSKDPLPRRTAAYTLPGHDACTLREADLYIGELLRSFGYDVDEEEYRVRAFGRDISKPLGLQYAPPDPLGPRYSACNVVAEKKGDGAPEDIILFVSHKDSQSWIHSPGASDNATGTSANLEIARIAASIRMRCTVRFLFCNEEHSPWTSAAYAERACRRGDNFVAIFNLDSLGSKSREELLAGRKTLATRYTRPEGAAFAELIGEVNDRCRIGLTHRAVAVDVPNDDDGSFVKAGYPMAVMAIGSVPNAYPHYHAESDIPENVDLENVRMAAQAVLGAALAVDRGTL